MFVLSDTKSVRQGLENKQSLCKDKIGKLEKNKQYLETHIKESENNLRELVTQKKSVAWKAGEEQTISRNSHQRK